MEISQETTVNIRDISSRSELSIPRPEGITIQESATTTNEGHTSSREWQTMLRNFLDRKQNRPFLPKWKRVFVASCAFAVLLDPLFFYIPIINNGTKCVTLDNHLKAVAISLRSTTDLSYVVDIAIQIYMEPKVPNYRVMGRSYLHTIVLTEGTILIEDVFRSGSASCSTVCANQPPLKTI